MRPALIQVDIGNGGPPGILYELLVGCFYYGFIAVCLAEVSLGIRARFSKGS